MNLPSLNAIVDVAAAEGAGWRPLDLAGAFLRGGARFLQLRAKTFPGDQFLQLARAMTEMTRSYGALLIVNDRADIARLAGADGVHVGQDDLEPRAVRRVVLQGASEEAAGASFLVGLSTHTTQQLAAGLQEPISYIAIGPVFGTSTKATGYEALGLERVCEAAGQTGDLPLVAIGGITLDTAPSVLAAGAAAVAVIGDLLSTGDPEARVRAYCERLAGRRGR